MTKNMAKLFVLMVFSLVSFVTHAQYVFEGELQYRNFENHNNLIRKTSFGMSYNGSRSLRVIMKNANIHVIDESMHLHTLYLPTRGIVIVYSDVTKEGQQFDYANYESDYAYMLAPHSKKKDFTQYSTVKYVKDKEYKGEICKVYKGEVTCQSDMTSSSSSSVDVEVWVSSKYMIHKSYYDFLQGCEVPGIAVKWTYDMKGKVLMLGKMSSYVASELKEIVERPVSDEEMKAPDGYEIKITNSPMKFLGLLKKNKKYLKKHKMHPVQIEETTVTYNIEEEWNF